MRRELSAAVLDIDPAAICNEIAVALREILRTDLNRRGLVVGISGGVDSAVCAALCVRALGPGKVFGLLMPERDSSSRSTQLGRTLAEQLGIEFALEDIAPALAAIGCYRWRDEAIRSVFPDYDGTWKHKLAIRGGQQGRVNYFALIAETPAGETKEERLSLQAYLQIVAATNFKQRLRKTLEYFHADRLHYAVVGTPNRLEYDQGFFVKNGDGSADVKPIAHLYKTQVYALARYLELPADICNAAPTTDTFSLPQGQDEFYFALPYHKMDLALWAHNHQVPAGELAAALQIEAQQAEWIYRDIAVKRRTTRYLHQRPVLIAPLPELKL
ncbi:MAG: NAD(+) synthase [Candidatus Krumholzibacteria bacterium]|nr:NAD(+) synthase [Candidatus Krumholzibacteria bacterium]